MKAARTGNYLLNGNRRSRKIFSTGTLARTAEKYKNKETLSYNSIPTKTQPYLFTPGPLATSSRVKWVTLRDVGSRDTEFIQTITKKLLEIAKVDKEIYTSVLMQGSGTFGIEAAFTTILPRVGAKVLVLENGAYGKRVAEICKVFGVDVTLLSFNETEIMKVDKIKDHLSNHSYTHVAMVHCETSSGMINDVGKIGKAVKYHLPEATFFLDAMSSFGAIEVPMEHVDVMVSSVNKCLQGIPGFTYVIIRNDTLNRSEGNARSLCLDLNRQRKSLDETGQFWCTTATHATMAFKEALQEFDEEGGIYKRAKRFKENSRILNLGMKKMGFQTLLNLEAHSESYIITSYHLPKHQNFTFDEFYSALCKKGFVIYPGKVTEANCFRIGTIGNIFPSDVEKLLQAIEETMLEMKIQLPLC